MNPWVYRIGVALLLAGVFFWLYPNSEPDPRPTWWQLEQSNEQQVSILGVQLPASNMQRMAKQLHQSPSIAMFTKRQRPNQAEPAMHIEAYFEDVYDEGDRIIIELDADDALLKQIKDTALRPEIFPNDVIRVNIPEDLTPIIAELHIKSITVIAGAQLRFEEFEVTFGSPNKILDDGTGNAHFLYPKLGLDFIQPANGLQILQFVAPDMFSTVLLNPLLKAQKIAQQ
ncbi:MAG: hypothetical protein R8M45_10405 [Ghiorsea sp.]